MLVNGVYEVVGAKVKVYRGNVSLTTNSYTSITPSNEVISPAAVPSFLSTYSKKLPAESVSNLSCKYFCQTCKNFQASTCYNTNIFMCDKCKTSSIAVRMKKNVCASIQFNGDLSTVKLCGPQMEQYFRRHGRAIPTDLNEIAVELLQDEQTTLLVDNRNNCVGFR